MQDLSIARQDDFRAGHDVIVGALGHRDDDVVRVADEPERAEARVAMRGDAGIAMMPGKGGVRNVTGARIQRIVIGPFYEGNRQADPRDLDYAKDLSAMYDPPGGV